MVTTTDTTQIVTEPKLIEISKPSLKRWFKHFFFLTATKRFFSKQDQFRIAQAVKAAEHGHIGEIQVVIEGHLPADQAYTFDTAARARQLFAELGVWDTEYNSGVLLYINLCDRKVELVMDRGIKNHIPQSEWNEICQHVVELFKQQNYVEAVVEGVSQIGQLLDQFYDGKTIDQDNELDNQPIIIG